MLVLCCRYIYLQQQKKKKVHLVCSYLEIHKHEDVDGKAACQRGNHSEWSCILCLGLCKQAQASKQAKHRGRQADRQKQHSAVVWRFYVTMFCLRKHFLFALECPRGCLRVNICRCHKISWLSCRMRRFNIKGVWKGCLMMNIQHVVLDTIKEGSYNTCTCTLMYLTIF